MNAFIDFVSDIVSSFRERLKNSFLSAFSIAFLISNWQAILYLLYSNDTIELKIEGVKDYYTSVYTLFLYPLGFAIFYVIGLPYLMWLFDYLSGNGIEERKKIRHSNYVNDLERRKKVAAVQYQLEQEKTGLREQSELTAQIEDLMAQLESKNKDLEIVRNERNSEQTKRQELDKMVEELRTQNDKLKVSDYPDFEIIFAEYGTDDTWIDVTEVIRKTAGEDGSKKITISHEDWQISDPVPNQEKVLSVIYKRNGQIEKKFYKENTTIIIRDLNDLIKEPRRIIKKKKK